MPTAKTKNASIHAIHMKIAKDVHDMLVKMAEEDRRDMTRQVEWLIEIEWRRRNKEAASNS